ncbi:hypothetical protein CPB86DRAFT_786567 [Serendipita vermifera]|nr:hypothetical protein CPB86DRAFT_786567 [Serendipita vermifera]
MEENTGARFCLLYSIILRLLLGAQSTQVSAIQLKPLAPRHSVVIGQVPWIIAHTPARMPPHARSYSHNMTLKTVGKKHQSSRSP